MEKRGFVITGVGAITPLGQSAGGFLGQPCRWQVGCWPDDSVRPNRLSLPNAGEVTDFDPGDYMAARDARRMARFSQLAVAAGLQAAESAGFDLEWVDPFRVGVLW